MNKLARALLAVAVSALPLGAQQFFTDRLLFEQALAARAATTTTIDFEGIAGEYTGYSVLGPEFTLGPVTFETGPVSVAGAGIDPYVVGPFGAYDWNSGAVFSPQGNRVPGVLSTRSSMYLKTAPIFGFGIDFGAWRWNDWNEEVVNFAFAFNGADGQYFEQLRTFTTGARTPQFFGVVTDAPFTMTSLIFDDVGSGNVVIFDNITVASLPQPVDVPEPVGLPLMAAGVIGLAYAARRRPAVPL